MRPSTIFVVLSLALATQGWQTDPPYYGQRYASLSNVRGLFVDPAGDLLAKGGGSNVVVVFEEDNGDGTIDVVSQVIISGAGLSLNHGLTYHDGYVYASSSTAVYRWPYTPGTRTQVTVGEEVVISSIPGGGHDTRTIIFDEESRLYVSIGSSGNVDQDSSRSRIRRFVVGNNLPIQFNSGEVFADGLRNEVGLAFDLNGVLHGVENGADQLNRPDLGGDIHNGNPAEEMNRFNKAVGQHYGYPYCFSVYDLQGQSAGAQFAWPSFMGDGTHTDVWCKTPSNNQQPLVAMGAHNAPLGIDFFRGQNCDGGNGAFPCNFTGDAFVAFHGSWNSQIPVGYRVGRFPFSNGEPTHEDISILFEPEVQTCYQRTCTRPVNAVFNQNGHLLVSSDATGEIIKITYGMEPKAIRNYVVKTPVF